MSADANRGLHTDAYAAFDNDSGVRPWSFTRRSPRANDVVVEVEYCGICHSDLHAIARQGQVLPFVPGHEIVGRVLALGHQVKGFGLGDRVAVGTIVDSCRTCRPCRQFEEPYCEAYPVTTYGGTDRLDGSRTQGGYSSLYVADADFVYHLPPDLEPAAVAPLLCAGITTYSPLRHWGAGPGKMVGVVGIGGLGHMALKFARAMGAHVVAFTTSAGKAEEALRLGAHEVVLSGDREAMAAQADRFDLLLNAASHAYPMDPFLKLLGLDGTLCSLGIPARFDFAPVNLTLRRRSLSSSGTGGTRRTREMLEFCGEHGIVADVEIVAPSQINDAFRRLRTNDVRYRFVIDLKAQSREPPSAPRHYRGMLQHFSGRRMAAQTKLRVLLTRRWPEAVVDYIAGRFQLTVDPDDRPLAPRQLIEAMANFDILCPTVTDHIGPDILLAGRRQVRLIANFGAGVDHIDLEAARRAGVPVTNTPDVLTEATADLALMLMLMASRRAGEGERELRSGAWSGWRPTHLLGRSLTGKCLGIVGLGRIGRATARKARSAMSMSIAYHAPRRAHPEMERQLDAFYCLTLKELAEQADVLSLHCPGSAFNRSLVNASLLSWMKPGAILINTARGSLVDEAALAHALREGHIAAAGLDVFEDEPNVTEELRQCPNAVLLPHLGSATLETRIDMGMRVVENIERFVAGAPLRDRVA